MTNKARDYLELYREIKDLEDQKKPVSKSLSDQLSRYECELENRIFWELRFIIHDLLGKFQCNEIDIPTFHGEFLTLFKDALNLISSKDSQPLLGFLHLQDNIDPKSKIFASHFEDLYSSIMDWDWDCEYVDALLESRSTFDEDEYEESRRQSEIGYRETVMDTFAEIEELFESE